jgi:hypothetical protein
MAVRINLDRVEYREPRMREIRWSICSSIRKQTIRFWIIDLQFCRGLLAQHSAATSSYLVIWGSLAGVWSQTDAIHRIGVRSRIGLQAAASDRVETAFMDRLALSPSDQIRLPKLDGIEPGTPSHRYHLDQLISLE